MPAILDQQFWNKLSQISNSVGLNPEDLLAVMYYESGLDPAAHNPNGNASGLIQFMPLTLESVGFEGSHNDFRQLNANAQLDYVERYVKDKMKFSGMQFRDAAHYYVANLWPLALKLPGIQEGDPKQPILEEYPRTHKYPNISFAKEQAAYRANKNLDVNKDGVISYGDLQAVINGVKKSSGYQDALNKLSTGQEYAVGTHISKRSPKQMQAPPQTPSGMPDDTMLAQIDTLLDKFMSALSSKQYSERFMKKEAYKKLFIPNNILIKIQADDFDTATEYARILCIALDEELYSDASIYNGKDNIEVECTIYGPKELSINATAQLCGALSETFEIATKKIGGCKVNTIIVPNKTSNYQHLDIKIAEKSYRNFHLKFAADMDK